MAPMIIMRGIALLFLVIGGALLALGLGGFADEWINANATCGDEYYSRPCEPGEAQGIMTLVGGIFAGVAMVLLVISVWLGRAVRPLTSLASTASPSGWSTPATAPTAPPASAGAEPLVDRLARLADLRDRGVLTDAEFHAQKAKLL